MTAVSLSFSIVQMIRVPGERDSRTGLLELRLQRDDTSFQAERTCQINDIGDGKNLTTHLFQPCPFRLKTKNNDK